MRLAPTLICYAPRRRRMSWVTRLALFLTSSALTGWLLTLIKHGL